MMLPAAARRAAPRLMGLKHGLPTMHLLPAMHFHSSTPMRKRDFYEVLGVASGASKNEIKKKYYELAKKFHPDTNKDDPNAAKKFAEATEAWEVLGDDDKRQKYDTFGHAGVDPNAGGGDGFHGGGFEDIFASMFGHQAGGRRSGRPQPQRGADVQVNCHVSFMEAVNGTTRDLNLNTDVTCEPCDGSGAKPGTSKRKCKSCGGSGVEILQQGFFAVEQPCRRCRGEGFIIETPCTSCRGRGKVKKARTVEVKIPEGVDNGMNLRLAHQGEAGSKGGPSGHLYVSISVASDPFFKRNKTDVHCEVPISVAQAILGGSIVVPTLTGQVEMTIPKGTQSGTTLKMRGKGIKELNSSRRGSQLVTMNVHIPDTLSARQKELMEEFAKEEQLRSEAGESSCKTHTFAETVQKTVDRIKAFLKPKDDDEKA
ncbi:chaperone DnaJ [Saprolegnia parasitica CBS 223.65]|uniref:Chaperone DnaJ n=1 Tax=Saprolegnia parasitica (strain CBS 223.65) TaxID=695850 RepID=A0A067CS00_SAPPC|nr:chaperone DnaJ [Saprolegnia parasitica CBS 223.65]KDO29577.1 chaperone DnaJ [Saprolegnia parasitica CBS 223.65]|eukprot:XP_012199641.1 chaperone DnaJ [Saprolegnia parasitica CBS 223.65]